MQQRQSERVFFAQADADSNVSTFLRARVSLIACRVRLFGTRTEKGRPFSEPDLSKK
jgi:hypothetical protein